MPSLGSLIDKSFHTVNPHTPKKHRNGQEENDVMASFFIQKLWHILVKLGSLTLVEWSFTQHSLYFLRTHSPAIYHHNGLSLGNLCQFSGGHGLGPFRPLGW